MSIVPRLVDRIQSELGFNDLTEQELRDFDFSTKSRVYSSVFQKLEKPVLVDLLGARKKDKAAEAFLDPELRRQRAEAFERTFGRAVAQLTAETVPEAPAVDSDRQAHYRALSLLLDRALHEAAAARNRPRVPAAAKAAAAAPAAAAKPAETTPSKPGAAAAKASANAKPGKTAGSATPAKPGGASRTAAAASSAASSATSATSAVAAPDSLASTASTATIVKATLAPSKPSAAKTHGSAVLPVPKMTVSASAPASARPVPPPRGPPASVAASAHSSASRLEEENALLRAEIDSLRAQLDDVHAAAAPGSSPSSPADIDGRRLWLLRHQTAQLQRQSVLQSAAAVSRESLGQEMLQLADGLLEQLGPASGAQPPEPWRSNLLKWARAAKSRLEQQPSSAELTQQPYRFVSDLGRDLNSLLLADVCTGNTATIDLRSVHTVEQSLDRACRALDAFRGALTVSLPGAPNTPQSALAVPCVPYLERLRFTAEAAESSCLEAVSRLGELGMLVPPAAKQLAAAMDSAPDPHTVTAAALLASLPPQTRKVAAAPVDETLRSLRSELAAAVSAREAAEADLRFYRDSHAEQAAHVEKVAKKVCRYVYESRQYIAELQRIADPVLETHVNFLEAPTEIQLSRLVLALKEHLPELRSSLQRSADAMAYAYDKLREMLSVKHD